MPIAEKENCQSNKTERKWLTSNKKKWELNSRKSEINIPYLYIPQDRYYIHNNLE